MNTANNENTRTVKLKFISMYVISILMLFIILSSFWQPMPGIKDDVSKENSQQFIHSVQPLLKQGVQKNNEVTDSMQKIISFYESNMRALDSGANAQKIFITHLQKELKQTITKTKPETENADVAKLKKQIRFYDWALRSQIAQTNTLTKENNRLKSELANTHQ